MELTAMIGIALVGLVLTVLFRQYRPEYAVFVSMICGCIILSKILIGIAPILSELKRFAKNTGMPEEYILILIKSLGICFVTQIACDACRDAGETSIGSKVEMAGKVAVMLLSLPLFTNILQTARKLIA